MQSDSVNPLQENRHHPRSRATTKGRTIHVNCAWATLLCNTRTTLTVVMLRTPLTVIVRGVMYFLAINPSFLKPTNFTELQSFPAENTCLSAMQIQARNASQLCRSDHTWPCRQPGKSPCGRRHTSKTCQGQRCLRWPHHTIRRITTVGCQPSGRPDACQGRGRMFQPYTASSWLLWRVLPPSRWVYTYFSPACRW